LLDPATATDLPPRNGPISRQRSAANAVVSYGVEDVFPAWLMVTGIL
jgi:hypothetical protein